LKEYPPYLIKQALNTLLNRIKKIWRFIRKHQRIGLAIFVVGSTWAFIGNTIMAYTPLSALDRNEGEVSSFTVKTYRCSGRGKYSITTCVKTEIKLNNSSRVFKLRETLDNGGMISGISVKNTVVIYIKHWYQFILTPGTWNGICQIEKGGEVYYEYWWLRAGYKAGMLIYGILCIVSWLFLVIEVYTEKNIRKKYSNTKPPVITLPENKD